MFGVCFLFTPTFRNIRLHPNVWGFVFFSPRGFYRAEMAATWTPRQQLTGRGSLVAAMSAPDTELSSLFNSSFPSSPRTAPATALPAPRREGESERKKRIFFSLLLFFSHSLLFLIFFLACASLSLSLSRRKFPSRGENFFLSSSLLLSLSPSLPHILPRLRVSLSLSLATEISVARREFFSLFFSSSLTLSSSSYSSSLARLSLSLSRDGNFRREERIFFLSSSLLLSLSPLPHILPRLRSLSLSLATEISVARREFFSLFFSSSLTLSSSSHSSLPARLSLSLATEISVTRREFFLSSSLLSLTLSSSSSHSSSPARLSLSPSRDGNFRREERIFFSLLLFFSHSLLFLTFFLACASLSLSLATEISVARREFFLSSSLLSLTLSSSSSHSSSPARLSLSLSRRKFPSRGENFFLSSSLPLSLSPSLPHILPRLRVSLSLSRDGNFRREERIFSLFFSSSLTLSSSSYSSSPARLSLSLSRRKFLSRGENFFLSSSLLLSLSPLPHILPRLRVSLSLSLSRQKFPSRGENFFLSSSLTLSSSSHSSSLARLSLSLSRRKFPSRGENFFSLLLFFLSLLFFCRQIACDTKYLLPFSFSLSTSLTRVRACVREGNGSGTCIRTCNSLQQNLAHVFVEKRNRQKKKELWIEIKSSRQRVFLSRAHACTRKGEGEISPLTRKGEGRARFLRRNGSSVGYH